MVGNAEEVLQTCHNVCLRVSETYQMGFVHNDLKTNNLTIDQDRDVAVIDLGNASEIGKMFCYGGSRRFWLAPEMYTKHPVSVKSDIFSVGIILSEIYVKTRIGRGFPKLLEEILNEDPEKRPSLEAIMDRLKNIKDAWTKRGQTLTNNE